MRTSLAKWEGKIVAFNGWYTSARFNQTWVCVKNAYVIPWDMDSSVQDMANKSGGVKLDHFWFSPDQSARDEKMYTNKNLVYKRIGSIGIVGKYRRNDGSLDFTVKATGMYSLEDSIRRLNNQIDRGCSLEGRLFVLDEHIKLIEKCQNGEGIVFGMTRGVSEYYQELLEQREQAKRSLKLQKEKEKTVLKNGKCMNLNQAKFKSKALKPPQGF